MAILPSNRRKGRGLKFEEGDPDTHGLERLGLDLYAAPDSFTHEGDIPVVDGKRFIFNQGATSSCVSNSVLHGVILEESRLGLPFDEPARLFPYYNSRRDHGAHLWDGGTYIRTLCHALRKLGCPSEQFWKWSQFSTKVNRRPNHKAFRHAHPRRDGKYVRIYENGDERIKAIQQALMNGHDVVFGTRLGVSFLSNNGPLLIDTPPPTEEVAGNHAMLIIGWAKFEGRLYFRVLNSWGSRWRDGGLCWMSADYIAWAVTRDIHIVHGWRRLEAA